MRGKFITIEGTEGVGKSTQTNKLKEYYSKTNKNIIFVREPGSAIVCEKIRQIILDDTNVISAECEALLYAASRSQLINEVILPSLNNGITVICDRYIDSSFAYQAYARNLGMDFVRKINSYAIENCMPDCTIFLKLEPSVSFKRKGGADANDRLEKEGIEFHTAVYEGYLRLAENESNRIFTIDASFDTEITHKNIISVLNTLIT